MLTAENIYKIMNDINQMQVFVRRVLRYKELENQLGVFCWCNGVSVFQFILIQIL